MGFFSERSLPENLMRLKAIPIFSGLDAKGLRIVDSLLHFRSFVAGEVIFDAGEEGQALYIVLEGQVLICRQGRPETDAIATLEPGSLFGELSLLDDAPRAAQARAATDCRLGVLFRSDFLDLLDTDARTASRIAFQLARHLGGRLRNTVHTSAGDTAL